MTLNPYAIGYIVPGEQPKYYCRSCSDHMTIPQKREAIEVMDLEDAPHNMYCEICCCLVEEIVWDDDDEEYDDV